MTSAVQAKCGTTSKGGVSITDLYRYARGPSTPKDGRSIITAVREAVADAQLAKHIIARGRCSVPGKPEQGYSTTRSCLPMPLGIFAVAKALIKDPDVSEHCHAKVENWIQVSDCVRYSLLCVHDSDCPTQWAGHSPDLFLF